MAASEVKKEDGGFFSNIPFFGAGETKESAEDEEFNPIKVSIDCLSRKVGLVPML